jgi:signal peptidase I
MTAEHTAAGLEEESTRGIFEKRIRQERRKKSTLRLCLDLFVTAAVVFLLFSVVAGIAVVQGDSMKPNLTNGSAAVFFRLDHTYRRNDIVIFQPAGKTELLIKRVAAVAGDKVDIDDKTGTFLVNGAPEQESLFIGKTFSRSGGVTFPFTVPNGCVFVLGDNRETALDSRVIGTVGTDGIIGKVVFEIKTIT